MKSSFHVRSLGISFHFLYSHLSLSSLPNFLSVQPAVNKTKSISGSPANLNPPGEPSFNEILIKTVRDYPPLYVNCRRSYDSVDRHEIWKEVAARIGRKVSRKCNVRYSHTI